MVSCDAKEKSTQKTVGLWPTVGMLDHAAYCILVRFTGAPLEMVTEDTTDVSEYLDFEFYD